MTLNGQIAVGELIMFIWLLEMIGPPLLDIPHLFSTSRQAFVCMDRLEEIRGPSHERTLETAGRLAELYRAWGREDEAELWRSRSR